MIKEEFDEYYKDVIDCVKSIIGDDIKIDYGNHFVNGKLTNDIYRCTIEKDYWRFTDNYRCLANYKVTFYLYDDSTFILYCGDLSDDALFCPSINTCNNEGKRYSNDVMIATITEFLKTNIPTMETAIAEHKKYLKAMGVYND